MLFKPVLIDAIEADNKTQTRRVVKDGEYAIYSPQGDIVAIRTRLRNGKTRLKWRVGRTYAICPGRGKSQVGRFLLTGIRREGLQDISDYDALAEGVEWGEPLKLVNGTVFRARPRVQFGLLWETINGPQSWHDNPAVWVLEFEYVEEST